MWYFFEKYSIIRNERPYIRYENKRDVITQKFERI